MKRSARNAALVIAMVSAIVLLPACKSTEKVEEAKKEYARPLPPGTPALRKVNDPERFRALLASSYRPDSPLLLESARRSREWFTKPSTKEHFPICDVSHDLAQRSVTAMIELLEQRLPRDRFIGEVVTKFDLYESVGWDGTGTVLYTGYYSPIFRGSLTPSGEFLYPLYKRPADLVTDPKTGKPLGRQVGDRIEPYPTRRDIEESGMLRGTELVWLASAFEAYVIHVNGSAKIRLQDGSSYYVGYAGKTDRPYKGLGMTMLERGLIPPERLSLPAIRDYMEANPSQAQDLINENPNYVFFTTYPADQWPAGSLGFQVTEKRSLATDKAIFPRGGFVITDTHVHDFAGRLSPFTQIMLDQDTGGAITAPGRADIYMGSGASAELLAGRQYQEGRLYYLFLKE